MEELYGAILLAIMRNEDIEAVLQKHTITRQQFVDTVMNDPTLFQPMVLHEYTVKDYEQDRKDYENEL